MRHRRFGPVPHSFERPIALALVDLDELDALLDRLPLWSRRRWAPVRFRRRDYLDGGDTPLAEALGDLIEDRAGAAAGGSRAHAHPPAHLGLVVQSHHHLLVLRGRRGDSRCRRAGGHQHPVEGAGLVRRPRRAPGRARRGVPQDAARLPLPRPRPRLPLHLRCSGPRRAWRRRRSPPRRAPRGPAPGTQGVRRRPVADPHRAHRRAGPWARRCASRSRHSGCRSASTRRPPGCG